MCERMVPGFPKRGQHHPSEKVLRFLSIDQSCAIASSKIYSVGCGLKKARSETKIAARGQSFSSKPPAQSCQEAVLGKKSYCRIGLVSSSHIEPIRYRSTISGEGGVNHQSPYESTRCSRATMCERALLGSLNDRATRMTVSKL
jgi:hypothetical protein